MADVETNGYRPRASVATIINGAIMVVMLVTMVASALGGAVVLTNSVGDIKADVKVLQGQMGDVRSDVRDMSRIIHQAEQRSMK